MHPITVRTIARTVVVGAFLFALAVAGRPGWLAVLLGIALVGVWAAPFLLVTNRRALAPSSVPPVEPLPVVQPLRVAEQREAGPTR